MQQPTESHLVYITASSLKEAEQIARDLVTCRLVACANVIDRVRSFYWWQGEVKNDCEALVIAKTQAACVDAVIARVKERHSYDCPCVVTWPLGAGNPGFLDWIAQETKACED
ncbi:MAG: divalent-cation tolerance protein CutA [Rhodospirillaceae bacterium]|nr:MAG: divalent-cation tolerance protein CutA [Rhodospirillaceae bacterium]